MSGWITTDEDQPDEEIAVDWSRLPEDWRTRSVKLRHRDETTRDYANRIRALVAEGLADARNLAFADSIEGRDGRRGIGDAPQPRGGLSAGGAL